MYRLHVFTVLIDMKTGWGKLITVICVLKKYNIDIISAFGY
jgi:hypothetical protein